MSGASNVTHWLEERGIVPDPELVQEIIKAAKARTSVLSEEEVLRIVASRQGSGS